MAYVTTTQLSARLGTTLYARLTDRVNGTTASDSVAQQLVDEAAAIADSYLARRYATPVDLTARPELADVLAARVLDLAEWGAWQSSPFVSDPPQRIHRLREAATRWLQDVADGRIALPATTLPELQNLDDNTPRYTAAARQFRHDELDGL